MCRNIFLYYTILFKLVVKKRLRNCWTQRNQPLNGQLVLLVNHLGNEMMVFYVKILRVLENVLFEVMSTFSSNMIKDVLEILLDINSRNTKLQGDILRFL